MIKKKEGFQGQRAIVLPRKIIGDLCLTNAIIKGLYVTDIGYYPKARHHYRQRQHGADQHILIYCTEGKGQVQIEKKQYRLKPDDLIVIPAGSSHNYAADEKDSWTIYWIHFKGTIANAIVDTMITQFKGHHHSITYQLKRLELFDDIYGNLERGYGNDNVCYANMCLWHFLSSFLYDEKFNLPEKKQSKQDNIIEPSINFMQQHLSEMLQLSDIANFVNLSVPHYSFLFRQKTGFAPIEYFNQLKIQKACQFLIFTDLRIKEIAEQLGIDDPYYFSRMFTRLMGVSPKEYRIKRHV
jgi:AraC-like DNA-binding protein/mannose-6-phosphate isomerase-like protein (cupin superfamily)